MSELIDGFAQFQGKGAWIIQVFIVVFLVLLFNFVQRRVLAKLGKKLESTKNYWDDALIDALRRPITFLIWIIGLAFAVRIVHTETQAAIFEAVGPIRDIGVIVTLAWFLIRLANNIEANIIRQRTEAKDEVDRQTLDAMTKLVRVSIFITTGLVILQTLGFSVSGVLAFGGIGGIATGFAAKDLLANFFGGLIIYLDKPFAIGDWVRSPDRDIEGTVEQIGWRLTRIRSFDKRPIYVPNAAFSTMIVVNPSRMSHRRIYETLGVRYADADSMKNIVADVEKMLREHPEIDSSQTLMVNFNSFAASSLDFFIYTFTRTTNWVKYHEVKQQILLLIYDIIRSHGADIAFPTRTLELPGSPLENVQNTVSGD